MAAAGPGAQRSAPRWPEIYPEISLPGLNIRAAPGALQGLSRSIWWPLPLPAAQKSAIPEAPAGSAWTPGFPYGVLLRRLAEVA